MGTWQLRKSRPCKFILPTADVRPVTMNNNFPCPAWFDITGLESRANETCSGLDESCDRIIAICQMK